MKIGIKHSPFINHYGNLKNVCVQLSAFCAFISILHLMW
ncbi:hypothetical protein YPPY66_1703 [Yersinia pestis PY-66]|uniref:Uncharacterized protein n=1 Tax=Yersinia pestis PY-08 TaxID=992134 RepID=A0AB72ZRT5_YERPE|nr:hypothetical protein YPPY02_1485 [Yersinia pestis PY-02]EIQ93855.1 hypothetical protein YPPY03_1564 [Yersinia pestis PY-03]EIR05437.1 hypothetical protein YPPY04_1523 [Yersinia pestis PY-04]EIR09717.1 hypothetical protein YPPY06_1531 [Yersinia pestis PY-06]EIR21273.1 hypothetical protein YPPY08_1543 [Yersinia pestis PY-08]EIR23172.1 hypothetical protein YPPY09_1549 [Yersinia pestis PY-09]EIR63881.1 hypothetical protein YPPY19_1596 [Yersinia pestis PY-19]EIR67650.1 hypothetical protein YPP